MSDTSSDPRAVAATLPAVLGGVEPVLITTSGSTGVPKTVVLSPAALRASASATAARIGEGAWLLALPVAYVAGLQVLVRAHLAGTSPVYLDGSFTPDAFVAAAREMPASAARYTSLVPAQLATLVAAAETEPRVRDALRSFEAILIGGQALPVPLRERAETLGVRIVRTYGSTETSGGCVYDGVPLDGVDVSVEAGEILIAGPTLADGYLGDDALTARDLPASTPMAPVATARATPVRSRTASCVSPAVATTSSSRVGSMFRSIASRRSCAVCADSSTRS